MYFVIFLIFIALPIQAQVNLEWAKCYNGTANFSDDATAIAIDDSGNVYVTGGSQGPGSHYAIATIKYDLSGSEVWIQRYQGSFSGSYFGKAIVTDDSGNVYVTGTITTLKYNRHGNILWYREMPITSEGVKITIDKSGDIIVAGSSSNDYMLLKYNSNGNLIWEKKYNGPADFRDELYDMVMDSEGNIIVTGRSHGIGTHWDYATVKYNSNGDSLWVRRYNGPCNSFPGDYPYAITVDDEDNIYVTGWSDGENCNPQCLTIAYSPTGDTLWEHRYSPSGTAGYEILYSAGYIYVVAMFSNYVDLLKYDKQGNLVWVISGLTYGSVVRPPRLITDNDDYIYLSGTRSFSFTISKISPAGSIIWVYQYPGVSNPGCFASAIAIDKHKNFYVTGVGYGWVCPGTDSDYLTIKVSQDKVSIDPNFEFISEYHLFQNYPNPFNPITSIKFSIPKTEFVTLKIYDFLGREITTLISEKRSPGNYLFSWDATVYSSGIYLYQLTAGDFSQTRRMILLK
jgi:hypothetical protein